MFLSNSRDWKLEANRVNDNTWDKNPEISYHNASKEELLQKEVYWRLISHKFKFTSRTNIGSFKFRRYLEGRNPETNHSSSEYSGESRLKWLPAVVVAVFYHRLSFSSNSSRATGSEEEDENKNRLPTTEAAKPSVKDQTQRKNGFREYREEVLPKLKGVATTISNSLTEEVAAFKALDHSVWLKNLKQEIKQVLSEAIEEEMRRNKRRIQLVILEMMWQPLLVIFGMFVYLVYKT